MMEMMPITQPNQPRSVRYLLEVSCLRSTASALPVDKFGSPAAVTPSGVTAAEEPESCRLLPRIMAIRCLLLRNSAQLPGATEFRRCPALLLQCRRTGLLLP